jgi:hypothetical protein
MPNLYSQSNSVIGLTVEFSSPLGYKQYADTIFLIKLEEDDNILKIKNVVESTFCKDSQIYFTGIEPGNYAIVAVGKKLIVPYRGFTEMTTFFSEELIKENIITVAENEFIYLGHYDIKTKMMLPNKKTDSAQLHFFGIITGESSIPRYLVQTRSINWYYRVRHVNINNISNKKDFIKKALEHFQGMEQEEIIKRNG